MLEIGLKSKDFRLESNFWNHIFPLICVPFLLSYLTAVDNLVYVGEKPNSDVYVSNGKMYPLILHGIYFESIRRRRQLLLDFKYHIRQLFVVNELPKYFRTILI